MSARSVPQRLAAWLMAALLALVVGEPLRLHECPVHSRIAASHEAGATTSAAHEGPGAHAAHAAHAADHDGAAHVGGQPGQTPAGHGEGHHCDCLGTCCTVAPVATPRLAEVHTAEWQVSVPAVEPVATLAAVPAGEHVLPFAIGPPGRA